MDQQQLWAKVLLDSASHRTFMTYQLAKRLKLTSERKEIIIVCVDFCCKNTSLLLYTLTW